MENLFTRGETIIFKIIGWIIALIVGSVLIWLFFKSKKETGKLEKRLVKEIEARKDLEKIIVEENAKRLSHLYHHEKESREKHCEWVHQREREISSLRKQLEKIGIPWDNHNISDERQREEVILSVKRYWNVQSKGGKINRQTIIEFLGENWENNFKNKEGEEIINEKVWLIKKIEEFKSSN